jgi:hypothetical protein
MLKRVEVSGEEDGVLVVTEISATTTLTGTDADSAGVTSALLGLGSFLSCFDEVSSETVAVTE